MERLTERNLACVTNDVLVDKEGNATYEALYNKLHNFEDLEEDLNVDLIKAMRLCIKLNEQKSFWVKEVHYDNSVSISEIRLRDTAMFDYKRNAIYSTSCGMYNYLEIKDYKIDWAISSDELVVDGKEIIHPIINVKENLEVVSLTDSCDKTTECEINIEGE